MKNAAIILGVLILIVGVGYVTTNEPPKPTVPVAAENTGDEAAPMEESVAREVEPAPALPTASEPVVALESEVLTPEPEPITETVVMSSAPGSYQPYNAELIAQSQATSIVLFFHASWCPSCRALDADLVANTARIPAGVEIYKLDYDTQTALKQQYGITRQHSVIQINPDGTAVSSVSHPLTAEDLLAAL